MSCTDRSPERSDTPEPASFGRRLLAALLGGACLLCASCGSPGADSPRSQPTSEAKTTGKGGSEQGRIYWGAWIGDHLTGEQPPWDMTAVDEFEQMVGKGLSIVHFAGPFMDCTSLPCHLVHLPVEALESIRDHGAIPLYSWSSQSIPSAIDQEDFELGDVIEGDHDDYIREFAEDAAEWGHPLFLRFNWEMNGNWFPWGEGVNDNLPGEQIAAWRHVHDVFASVGADNVTWVWCPDADPNGLLSPMGSFYPGDEYVDWTCLDGYNWGTSPVRHDRWRSFDGVFRSAYERLAGSIAPTKPIMIGEFGTTEHGGSKAAWLREALAKVPTEYPRIRALVWFEVYDNGMDWPLVSSRSATQAFSRGIRDRAYLTGEFGSLDADKIEPAPR